jgi:hypothetical protein
MYAAVLSYLISLYRAAFVVMFISVETKWRNISGIFVPKDEAKKTVFESALQSRHLVL